MHKRKMMQKENYSQMPLLSRIVNYMKIQVKEVSLNDIYERFGDIKPSTIRGRINESVGSKLLRVGKGKYLLIDEDVEAIIEQTDSRFAIPNILASLMYYDMVFFDIPYYSGGQKGGNRDLSSYALIMPEEFEKMMLEVQKMLRTEDSQVYFMIAGGKSSKKDALKYLSAFGPTDLKAAGKGSYTKLTSKGTVCNMGAYEMPPEDIFVYSHSGKLLKPDETVLDFRFQRPKLPKAGGYPTQKPLDLLEKIISQGSNVGDFILDLFGGSGVSLEAALKLKRKCHIFDIADDAIKRMVAIAEKYKSKTKAVTNKFNYNDEQIRAFASGSLF